MTALNQCYSPLYKSTHTEVEHFKTLEADSRHCLNALNVVAIFVYHLVLR